MHKTVIQSIMRQYVTAKSQEIIAAKPDNQKYLEHEDMQTLASYIERFWSDHCGEVPVEITAITNFACASLDPDKSRRIKMIRDALSAGLGVSGILTILGAIGTAAGWGAGWWAIIMTTIGGSTLAGPLGVAAAGSLAVLLAGYLMFFKGDKAKASDKALKLLRDGITDVITDSMWDKYKDKWKE